MRLLSAAASVTGLAMFIGAARAQDAQGSVDKGRTTNLTEEAAKKAEDAPAAITISLTPRVEHTFEAELKDSGAKSSITRAGLNVDLRGPISERWRWSLALNEESSWYNWQDISRLLPSAGGRQPIGEAHEVSILPGASFGINKEWSVFGGAIVQFAGERDADVGDSATFGGFGGVRYVLNDAITLSFGIGVKSRLESSAGFIPFLGLNWKITDKVTLASEGTGVRVSAAITDAWTFSIFGRYERREYRLDDDNPIPEGVARDTRIPIGAGVAWRPCDRFRVSLDGGVIVYQEFIFDDRDGNRIARDRTEPAAFVGLSGLITF